MPYEKCSDVSPEYWHDLQQADPEEVQRRTGLAREKGAWRLPFLNRELFVDPDQNRVWVSGAEDTEPNFRTCLTAVLYLLRVDPSALGTPVSPKELTGASTFIQAHGPHSLPTEPLERTFGANLPAFLEAGRRLGASEREDGDAALSLTVYPGLSVEVILWEADEEFPAQASFTVPAHLERFMHLDAVLGLLQLVVGELQAASPEAGA